MSSRKEVLSAAYPLNIRLLRGARPLLDHITGRGTIPATNPSAASPEPDPYSAAVLPSVPVTSPDHLPEAETQPSVLPPQPEPLWLPEMPNTGKWLPVSNLPSIPFFPIRQINPAVPFMPIPNMPTIPGIPFVPPFPGLEQLQGWAFMSNPSQQMPFGSFGGYPIQP
ncbi:hypothetical protein COCNU_scaffold004299G000010 [Cocos nucifera]|nr:hypothetical protein [Cocos nucifera]